MQPKLKNIVWERADDELRVLLDLREELLIADPSGAVEQMLELLREGGRDVAALAAKLGRPEHEVAEAIAAFDANGFLEDGERLGLLSDAEAERYFSNLAFFEMFGSLDRSREDLQRALRDAHVLVLGTGGLSSNTVPHLCGLGIGRLTLLDRDAVDTRNFARQYLYQSSQVGGRKVHHAGEWVRRFDPSIKVDVIDDEIDGADRLSDLVERTGPAVVLSGVDRPDDIDAWVNAACVAHGVPFVRGGLYDSVGVVWSVDPGRSGCWACRPDADPADDPMRRLRRLRNRPNRTVGPVAGMLGALCAFEVARYITGYEAPAYAGNPAFIDFADRCSMRSPGPWSRAPDCRTCRDPAAQESSVTS